MKVSLALPDLRAGGAERVNVELAREFASWGYSVEFVVMRRMGELLPEAELVGTVCSLDRTRLRQVPIALMRYLRRRQPDALLASMWPLTGIGGFAVRWACVDTRLVASEHTDLRTAAAIKPYERAALRYFGSRIYGPCPHVVAVSEGVAQSLRDVAGLGGDRIRVIHNPVRPFRGGELAGDDRSRVAGWLEGSLRLISVGTLKPPKGYDVLLRAFAELRQRRDATLLILGDGPLREELKGLARELGVADYVWLPGFRDNPGVFLQHADVFALSSNREGLPTVLVEALSAGLPVVSTDCRSGPSEILESGRYGRLVPVDDPSGLARGIEEVVANPPDAQVLKKRAADFAPEEAAKAYLDLMFPSGKKTHPG